jgi:hypothetical protein
MHYLRLQSFSFQKLSRCRRPSTVPEPHPQPRGRSVYVGSELDRNVGEQSPHLLAVEFLGQLFTMTYEFG